MKLLYFGLSTWMGDNPFCPAHCIQTSMKPGPKVIKHASYSTQLSLIFFLLINVKMPIVGILRFISRKKHYWLIRVTKLNFLIF